MGNCAIDGEVIGKGCRIALEIKTPGDDVTRGIGQLTEALAYGYDKATMVTTFCKAKTIDCRVFRKMNLILLGVDSKGNVVDICQNMSCTKCYIG